MDLLSILVLSCLCSPPPCPCPLVVLNPMCQRGTLMQRRQMLLTLVFFLCHQGPEASLMDRVSSAFFVNIISWVLGHLWGPNPAISCSSMFLFSCVLVLLLLTQPTKASFPHTCTYLHQRKREGKINE